MSFNPAEHPKEEEKLSAEAEASIELKPHSSSKIDADADFDDEELGERQPEACSLDEGCQTCQ